MKNKIIFGAITFVFITSFCVFLNYNPFSLKTNNYGAAFFSMGATVKDLIVKYSLAPAASKIKILIVPGHEPDLGGAEYGSLLERDLNLELAEKIQNNLTKNDRFEIIMARDEKGWNPTIENYVNKNETKISSWKSQMKNEMLRLVNNGKVSLVTPQVYHANAIPHAVLFLYGINKWASENKIDIVLNVHFNDNPKYKGKPKYEGYSIYVPEKQYSNSASSKTLAENLMDELSKIKDKSTMPGENQGIVEDQELIAIGSYNTSDSLNVLIEYAYIYEDFMQATSTRNTFLEKAASSTSKALQDFFTSRTMFI